MNLQLRLDLSLKSSLQHHLTLIQILIQKLKLQLNLQLNRQLNLHLNLQLNQQRNLKIITIFFILLGPYLVSAEVNSTPVNSMSNMIGTTPANSNSSEIKTEIVPEAKIETQNEFFGNLYRVNDNSVLTNNHMEEAKSSVWVIFQNDCKACHRMMLESKCLKSKSSNKLYFIGIQSRPEVIAKAVVNYVTLDKVLYSKGDLVEKLNISVTPTVYIFKNSKLVRRIDNFASCREIKKLI